MAGYQLFNKSCRDMTELADESVQMVVTSPPYWGLRKYDGDQDEIWCGRPDCEHELGDAIPRVGRRSNDNHPGPKQQTNAGTMGRDLPSNSNTCQLCGAWRGAFGHEPTVDMYVSHLIEILREVKRVLRPDGVAMINLGDSYFSGSAKPYGTFGIQQPDSRGSGHSSAGQGGAYQGASSSRTSGNETPLSGEPRAGSPCPNPGHKVLPPAHSGTLDCAYRRQILQFADAIRGRQHKQDHVVGQLPVSQGSNEHASSLLFPRCPYARACVESLSSVLTLPASIHQYDDMMVCPLARQIGDLGIPEYADRHSDKHGISETGGALVGRIGDKAFDSSSYPYYSTPHRPLQLKPKDLCLIPFRVALAAQADGWWVRSDIIWSKPNPMPESVKDRPTNSHEHILMLTKSGRYYWDSIAVRENTAGATDFAPPSRPALAPEHSPTLDANYGTANLRGQLYLSEAQITIVGAVAFKTQGFKVIKSIRLSVIGEVPERDYVIDLQESSGTASLALITSTLKDLATNNTPVRATIIHTTTPECGVGFTDSMNTIPLTTASTATEPVDKAVTLLTRIALEGAITLVTLYSDKLGSPLDILGTFRSSHIAHNTINTAEVQGRNVRDVWEFPTQPYPGAHFAVFPAALPERCIKAATPEYGCCEKCGKPWERIIENKKCVPDSWHNSRFDDGKNLINHPDVGRREEAKTNSAYGNKSSAGRLALLRQQSRENGAEYESNRKTTGWQSACRCEAGVVPSLVLDPFAGSGTTLWVAIKLGRNAVGYELSSSYCDLIRNRVSDIQMRSII